MSATTLNFDHLQTSLDSLLGSLKTDDTQARKDYEHLYNAIGRGEPHPDNATICNILRNAEKTMDDLKADVEWRIKRLKMIEEYRTIPGLESELDTARAEIRKLQAELEKLEADYEAKKQPYRSKVSETERHLHDFRDYRATLIRECRCEALTTELENAEFQLKNTENEYAQLRADIYRQNGRITEAEEILNQLKMIIYADDKAERQRMAHETIHDAEATIKVMEKRFRQLEPKLAAQKAEAERIREQMLDD